MDVLNELLDMLRERARTVVAVVLLALLLVALTVFSLRTIWPGWQARTALLDRLAAAEAVLEQQDQNQQNIPEQIQMEIEAAQTAVFEAAQTYLTEPQAAELLDTLYQHAAASGVEITDLQVQPTPELDEKSVYDLRLFRLQAVGPTPQLLDFLGRVREAAVPSVALTNLMLSEMEPGSERGLLVLNLQLYTSPYAAGSALADLPLTTPPPPPDPIATPSPAPTTPMATAVPDVDALTAQLHIPWQNQDWSTVIEISEQILALDASYPDVYEKLYAAYVNYGYQLAAAGNVDAARSQFELALAIRPQGVEAQAGLQSLLPATPTPQIVVYEVLGGDTLFSIARRFGVSLDALRAANGLTNNNIRPGQELIIP